MNKSLHFFAYLYFFLYFWGVKKKIFILIALCCIGLYVQAETKEARELMKHEVRLGWGDQLFETLIWHNPTNIIKTMPESYRYKYNENHRYFQHIWAEYQNRYLSWFSYGVMVDFGAVAWDEIMRNGRGQEMSRSKNHFFYNLTIMPTINFTYFHHEYVNLYSGLGIGMDINGGTESNAKGHKTDLSAAVNITILGVSANYNRWFWFFDYGGMYALKNRDTIFMAKSRMMNAGFGVRF